MVLEHLEVKELMQKWNLFVSVPKGMCTIKITMLQFKNIKDFNGNILSDHIWFDYGKRFKILGKLNKGDIIYCNGKVTKYKRSNNSIDFSLSNLKRIRRNKSSKK